MKSLPLTTLVTLASVSLASFAGAADSGGHLSVMLEKSAATVAPFHFSLTVMPVQFGYKGGADTSALPIADILNHTNPAIATSTGIKIDTGVAAGPISGGVTYLKGSAVRANAFSSWYATSPKSDLGLQPVFILPNEYLDPYSALNASNTDDKAQGLVIHGGYELTPNLQINGAFLVAKSEKLAKVDDLSIKTEQTNWRLDLGGAYKFEDNITYSINFGYLDGGGNSSNKDASSSWQGNSAYVVKHQLNMSF